MLGGVYVFLVVPETKGRPLLEIQKLMQLGGLVPMRFWGSCKRTSSEWSPDDGALEGARLRVSELSCDRPSLESPQILVKDCLPSCR